MTELLDIEPGLRYFKSADSSELPTISGNPESAGNSRSNSGLLTDYAEATRLALRVIASNLLKRIQQAGCWAW